MDGARHAGAGPRGVRADRAGHAGQPDPAACPARDDVAVKGPWRDLRDDALAQGWTVEKVKRGGHTAWMCPTCLRRQFSASTAGDSRAVKNFTSVLRRHGLMTGGREAMHQEESTHER
jgi:hypothetical protein